jgi:hypothetical protein
MAEDGVPDILAEQRIGPKVPGTLSPAARLVAGGRDGPG